jgi:signal peptidase II
LRLHAVRGEHQREHVTKTQLPERSGSAQDHNLQDTTTTSLHAADAAESAPRSHLRAGLVAGLVVCAVDQLVKLWLIFVFDLGGKGFVSLAPILDLVLVWNTGISYGLFQQESDLGRWVLLGLKVAAVALLTIWLFRASSRLTAISLGLIIGGAVGNAIDRLAYGAVADFVLFHITTQTWQFRWYVFNVADAAIVAGVIGLLYDSLRGSAVKAP